MALSDDGKRVFRKFCLIGIGIPLLDLAIISILYFSPWSIGRAEVSGGVLNLVAAGLAVTGLAIWAFFSFVIYRRLWKIFPYISEKEKGWSFAEGTFGYVGVGVFSSSVLGVFYYLFSGEYYRGLALIALSFVLFLVEAAMFPNRIAEVESVVARMD